MVLVDEPTSRKPHQKSYREKQIRKFSQITPGLIVYKMTSSERLLKLNQFLNRRLNAHTNFTPILQHNLHLDNPNYSYACILKSPTLEVQLEIF